jgi:uncharacterized protein (DUF1800 family)
MLSSAFTTAAAELVAHPGVWPGTAAHPPHVSPVDRRHQISSAPEPRANIATSSALATSQGDPIVTPPSETGFDQPVFVQ